MQDQAERLRQLAKQAKHGMAQAEAGARALLSASPSQPNAAQVIAVTSGKGGVGKSNISINLSLALCRLGKQVILFDADLGMANVDVLLGISPQYTLQHVVHGQKHIHEVLTEGPLGLKVIASGNGISQLANLSNQQRERILSHFALIEDRADYIIIDTGAGISRNVISFVLAADQSLVVTTPEPTARLDAYGLIKVTCQEDFNARLSLVVNQAKDEREGEELGGLMRTLAQRFLGMHLDYLGSVPKDPKVWQAVREQNPFVLGHPGCPASLAVNALAERLSATHEASAERRSSLGGFFGRLAGLFNQS
jgi:flagellar biosynthesis protein FlhG